MTLALIARQLRHQQRGKVEPDIAAMIRRAILEALDPARQPTPGVTRPWHWTTSLPAGVNPLSPSAQRLHEHHLAEKKADNLQATIREAVNEALHAAGVIAAPQPKPSKLPEMPPGWHLIDHAPPLHTPIPAPAPAPATPLPARPAPFTFPEVTIQRDAAGNIAAFDGPPGIGRITVTRNRAGRIAGFFSNGQRLPEPESVEERDQLGRFAASNTRRGRLTVRRNELGLVDTVFLGGKVLAYFHKGADGTVAAISPDRRPTRYDGKAVPPASINARE